jgi:uncharacterized protein YjhX (UPF0386 family)
MVCDLKTSITNVKCVQRKGVLSNNSVITSVFVHLKQLEEEKVNAGD